MADPTKKISELTEAALGAFTDLIEISKIGASRSLTLQKVYNLFGIGNKIDGPASSSEDNLPSFSSTTGKVLKDSGINIADGNLRTVKSIRLNSVASPLITGEGDIYWNNKYYTPEYDTGLGATVKIGQTVYDVFYNDTGSIIAPFKALHLKSGVLFDSELYPTFELADASDYEKIQGTICISCCSVGVGELGLCVRDATKLKGGSTSAIPPGSQLWVADDGTGDLTHIKPEFPSAAISVGGNYNQEAAPDGEIFINITTDFGDIYHEAWDGSIIETFNFTTSSNGTIVTGLLENVNSALDLTLNFSDGTFKLDTTTAPLTIALTPGTDSNEQTNYVYIPKSTKVLTVSTSGWPVTEHCRIAELEIQSALTTQTDGGALGNQNTNDHVKKEDDNGHILHIAAWIRKQFATFESGTEATLDNTGGNGYVEITGGIVNQLHEQSLSAFSMVGGDDIRVWNDFSGNRPKLSNLAAITAYSDGSTWNNAWGKIVVWRVANKTGEYSPVMFNLPSSGYNSEANALADALNYANYSIPKSFKTKAILVCAFTFRISGGVITYNGTYEDLRGQLPITVAGGGGGGAGGVTTYLALTDTPNSRAGKSGNVVVVNSGETADEYEPKGWIFNVARTFKAIFNIESLTADRTFTWPNISGLIAVFGMLNPFKFGGQAWSDEHVQTFSAATNFNLDNGNLHSCVADQTSTLSVTNKQLGSNYELDILTDATGGYTLTFDSSFGTISANGESSPLAVIENDRIIVFISHSTNGTLTRITKE